MVKLKLMKVILVGTEKASVDEVQLDKVAVFGLLKRNGQVYTDAVPNTQTATLFPIIREQLKSDSIVYTDSYRIYDVSDVSEFSHF